MKILLILTTILLSSCVASNCQRLGGGVTRCDYPDSYCIKSVTYIYGKGIVPVGMQCFEKKGND